MAGEFGKGNAMAIITILYGAGLTLLGLYAYLVMSEPDSRSITALIPAFFGIVFLLLGFVALSAKLKKHAMHAAAGLGLLAILGTAGGVMKLPTWFDDPASLGERADAVPVQSIMFAASVVFVGLCVWSFIQARRAKKAA
mgnify:FL=1